MWLAKYIENSVYIGCIIDQSNWSGPFSLMVTTPDSTPGTRPALVGCFYLQVYISPPTTVVCFIKHVTHIIF